MIILLTSVVKFIYMLMLAFIYASAYLQCTVKLGIFKLTGAGQNGASGPSVPNLVGWGPNQGDVLAPDLCHNTAD